MTEKFVKTAFYIKDLIKNSETRKAASEKVSRFFEYLKSVNAFNKEDIEVLTGIAVDMLSNYSKIHEYKLEEKIKSTETEKEQANDACGKISKEDEDVIEILKKVFGGQKRKSTYSKKSGARGHVDSSSVCGSSGRKASSCGSETSSSSCHSSRRSSSCGSPSSSNSCHSPSRSSSSCDGGRSSC